MYGKKCVLQDCQVIVGRAEYRVFVVRAVERFYWKNVRTGFEKICENGRWNEMKILQVKGCLTYFQNVIDR